MVDVSQGSHQCRVGNKLDEAILEGRSKQFSIHENLRRIPSKSKNIWIDLSLLSAVFPPCSDRKVLETMTKWMTVPEDGRVNLAEKPPCRNSLISVPPSRK